MFGFIFGVMMGFFAKTAYDFFQEERIPTDLGMAQGRAEAIMDETRQIVREIREELRSAATATQESVSKKVERRQSAAAGSSQDTPSASTQNPARSSRTGNAPSTSGGNASPSGS